MEFSALFNLTTFVLDTRGNPINGANVILIREDQEIKGTTNDKGKVKFTIPPGNYYIDMFIDDEEILVELGCEILKKLGYQVESTTTPDRALKMFRKRPDRFDLVITDLTMPQLTGDELAVKLMQIRPDIPIILCTGYKESFSLERAKDLGIRAFEKKPLVIRDLASTIRRVMG